MPLSDKTLAEMTAGAETLAKQQGEPLPAGYMEAMIRTHDRRRLLSVWERQGDVTMETVTHYNGPKGERETYVLHHVKNGPTFDDIEAVKHGAYPSEVLIANIALALQARGGA